MVSCDKKEKQQVAGNRQQGPLSVDGFFVAEHPLSDEVEVPGTLLPEEETQIRSEVSGRVIKLNINEGAVVQRGELLVKLFDADLQAQLNKLQVQLEIAIKNEERNKELLQINGISQQDYDLATLQVENLKADIQSTRIAISKTEIRAPYRGQVGLRNISLGAYLSPAEVITTLRKVDRLKLEFAVPEKYAREISQGNKIRFKVDGGEETHRASVIATESQVDQATRTLRVRGLVTEKHPELVPGIFARVTLQLGKVKNGLLVPTQAVIPQARNKEVILFKNDSVQFVEVETGLRDSVFVQITKGVAAGDTVITTGLMAIRPGAKVRLNKVNRYKKN
ncbi:MAG TPA: efflux RND transporter periplasmic adaptor subunit [Ohtaekwangia sp.]|nr:efflux RND transporter periplasmic adaptor subunit [Ohtaekwangia sp.]